MGCRPWSGRCGRRGRQRGPFSESVARAAQRGKRNPRGARAGAHIPSGWARAMKRRPKSGPYLRGRASGGRTGQALAGRERESQRGSQGLAGATPFPACGPVARCAPKRGAPSGPPSGADLGAASWPGGRQMQPNAQHIPSSTGASPNHAEHHVRHDRKGQRQVVPLNHPVGRALEGSDWVHGNGCERGEWRLLLRGLRSRSARDFRVQTVASTGPWTAPAQACGRGTASSGQRGWPAWPAPGWQT